MNWFWFAFASAILIFIETIIEKKVLKKEHAMQFSTTLAISIAIISLIFLPYLNSFIILKFLVNVRYIFFLF